MSAQISQSMSDAEKRAHAIRLNINRRHLSDEQRDSLARTLDEMGYKIEAIADMMQIGVGTVHRAIHQEQDETTSVFPTGKTESSFGDKTPGRKKGKDGKSYPARKPRKAGAVFSKNGKEQERAQQALAILGDDARAGEQG